MPIRKMKNERPAPHDILRRATHGDRQQKQESIARAPQTDGLEICVCEDCTLGPIEDRPVLAVLRFTTGFVHYRKFGPLFEERLRFFDQRKHKFAHSLCAYDLGINVDQLCMEQCNLCDQQFFCERGATECCLLVEQGYFQSVKRGLFSRFVAEKRGAVHWSCARVDWKQKLLTEEFRGALFDDHPT